MKGRREVGEGEEGGIHLFDDFAIGFGLVAHRNPFRIVAKGGPIGGGGFAAWRFCRVRALLPGPLPLSAEERRRLDAVLKQES